MKVIIAGAGVGGLTAALSLHKLGIEVELFDAAPELVAKGHGINLLPHGSAVLADLGLEEAIDREGIQISKISYYSRFGKFIADEPRDMDTGGFSHPQYMINRGELQMILLRAAWERLGPDCVRTKHAIASFEQDEQGVSAVFVDPATGEEVCLAKGDVLIGADGIRSTVRSILYPNEGDPAIQA